MTWKTHFESTIPTPFEFDLNIFKSHYASLFKDLFGQCFASSCVFFPLSWWCIYVCQSKCEYVSELSLHFATNELPWLPICYIYSWKIPILYDIHIGLTTCEKWDKAWQILPKVLLRERHTRKKKREYSARRTDEPFWSTYFYHILTKFRILHTLFFGYVVAMKHMVFE